MSPKQFGDKQSRADVKELHQTIFLLEADTFARLAGRGAKGVTNIKIYV